MSDDLISRRALYERAATLEAQALDYVGKLIERDGEETSVEWRIWSAILTERTAFKHDVYDAPSAQPDVPDTNVGDMISRQAAIDALACLDDYEEQAIEALRKLPSAQPEIIRCRDCESWDVTWTNDWSPEYHYCPMIDGVRKGDFYCADAERRTDERSD